jgi:Autotransporter beta-domain/Viral BACON domain
VVTGVPAWASLSASSGTLAPGASVSITLTLSASAAALPIGTQNAILAFNNTTNGIGSTTRTAALTVDAPAALVITPPTGFTASGPQGGQGGNFTPLATVYSLKNTGSVPLNFAVSGQKSWLTVSADSGTIPAGGTVTVGVAINGAANALPAGMAISTLVFTNTTNNIGTGSRDVTLNVIPPARLAVTAADGLVSSGTQSGPFSPSSKSYTLSNLGSVPMSYSITSDRGWIDVSAAAGMLPAGGSTTVTVAINTGANSLASGSYAGTVTLTNVTSGLGTTTRPVALSVIPNGQVILRVETTDGDGTYKFSSPTSALSLSLTSSNGRAESTAVSLKPGTYSVTATPPDGFGLTAVTCSNSGSSGSASTRSATIKLVAAETVICTFSSTNSRKKTTEVIGKFLSRRNDLIASSSPDAGRQIDRLIEAGPDFTGPRDSGNTHMQKSKGPNPLEGEASGTIGSPIAGRSALASTALGARALNAEASAGNAEPTGGKPWQSLPGTGLTNDIRPENEQDTGSSRLVFGTSLSQVLRLSADREHRKLEGSRKEKPGSDGRLDRIATTPNSFSLFDIWVQGQYSRFSDDRNHSQADGHFGVLHAGADYILNSRVLFGIQGQFDSMRMRSMVNGSEIEGRGWMVGPYGTIRLSEHLFLQARAAAGQSQNTISPYLTFIDQFSTTRWLASSTLVGRWQYGSVQLRPSASITYIEDVSNGYIDGLGVNIPKVKSSLGQMKVGPEVNYRYDFTGGASIEPRAGLQAIWNFAGEGNGASFGDSLTGPKEIRGRAELGLKLQSLGGTSLDLSANYDGIGSTSYHAVGGKAAVRIPLN